MNLPSRVKIPNEIYHDNQYNAVADYLSDTYGFCVSSFRLKSGYAVSIKWDIGE